MLAKLSCGKCRYSDGYYLYSSGESAQELLDGLLAEVAEHKWFFMDGVFCCHKHAPTIVEVTPEMVLTNMKVESCVKPTKDNS